MTHYIFFLITEAVTGWRSDHWSVSGDEDSRLLHHTESKSQTILETGNKVNIQQWHTWPLNPAGITDHVCWGTDQPGSVYEECSCWRQRHLDDVWSHRGWTARWVKYLSLCVDIYFSECVCNLFLFSVSVSQSVHYILKKKFWNRRYSGARWLTQALPTWWWRRFQLEKALTSSPVCSPVVWIQLLYCSRFHLAPFGKLLISCLSAFLQLIRVTSWKWDWFGVARSRQSFFKGTDSRKERSRLRNKSCCCSKTRR